ncbi:MAG: cobalt-precorrin-5B (C(1))-methyltransferase CbiD [Planctomycetes bacterium]|nr:cobalt-precorrin-5B (C(1))-methyltransferase CbiD [Planctomycetota bacterium]
MSTDASNTRPDKPAAASPLRTGFTTGTCAAVAAGAAATLLIGGETVDSYSVTMPDGTAARLPVRTWMEGSDSAVATVIKDAGDDPDITDGIEVVVRVTKRSDADIRIDGGAGVGRVTKPGLDQPVGAAAINSVPRQMIARAVDDARTLSGYPSGFDVLVTIPQGEVLAARTFNPRLGIVGGLSVLGTTGIVEPMSSRALLDSLEAEMRMHRAGGSDVLVITPGKYGEAFLSGYAPLRTVPSVVCANYIGDALDRAVATGFDRLVFVGHIGKMIKLSGGILDTHSRVADGRLELLALQAALAGAGTADLGEILEAATVDQGLETVTRLGFLDAVLQGILDRAEKYLRERAGRTGRADDIATGLVLFSNRDNLVAVGADARAIIDGLS